MRSSSGRELTGHRSLSLSIGLAAFLALVVFCWPHAFYAGQANFWDAGVYARAIRAFEHGEQPYVCDTPLAFVYPPVFLYAGSALGRVIHGGMAWRLYLLLDLLAIIAFPVIIAVGYIRSRWFNAGCALLVSGFHPFFTSVFAFFTGNLSTILYALLLLAGIPGFRRNRWMWFYVAVGVAAAIKIPMLAFLLLPILLGTGQGLSSLLTASVVLSVNAAQWFAIPNAYHAYLVAARYEVLARSDVGYGVFGFVFRVAHRSAHVPVWLPFLAHTLVVCALAAALWCARARGIPRGSRQSWAALVLMLPVLCNPRTLAYDLDLLVVPLAFLVGDILRVCLERQIPAMVLASCSLAIIIALGRSPLYTYYFVAVIAFPIAGYLWLSSSESAARNRVTDRSVLVGANSTSPVL